MSALPFPVAKVRPSDGVPAVWLTFTNWLAIKEGLVREYIQQRKFIGARLARVAAHQADSSDIWGGPFEEQARDAAFELYRIGYEAHRAIHERGALNCLTPEQLVVLGDSAERRAGEHQAQQLAQKGEVSNGK